MIRIRNRNGQELISHIQTPYTAELHAAFVYFILIGSRFQKTDLSEVHRSAILIRILLHGGDRITLLIEKRCSIHAGNRKGEFLLNIRRGKTCRNFQNLLHRYMEDHRFHQAMGTAGLHHIGCYILRNILSGEKDSLTIRHIRVLYRNLALLRACDHIDIRNNNALLIQDKRLI